MGIFNYLMSSGISTFSPPRTTPTTIHLKATPAAPKASFSCSDMVFPLFHRLCSYFPGYLLDN